MILYAKVFTQCTKFSKKNKYICYPDGKYDITIVTSENPEEVYQKLKTWLQKRENMTISDSHEKDELFTVLIRGKDKKQIVKTMNVGLKRGEKENESTSES